MTKIRIIARLWSHITDLRLYIKGQSRKDIEQIEKEIEATEQSCRYLKESEDSG